MDNLTQEEKMGFNPNLLFNQAMDEVNTLPFLDKVLHQDSEHYVENMCSIQDLALTRIAYIADWYINRDTPDESPWAREDYSDEELKNMYNKAYLIYTYTNTFIDQLLKDNFFGKTGDIDDNKQFITKLDSKKTETYDFCFIENDIIFWYEQTQQLGIVLYHLHEYPEFISLSLESFIEKIMHVPNFKLKKGKWSSVRIKALDVQANTIKRKDKLIYPFDLKIDLEFALDLIYNHIKKHIII